MRSFHYSKVISAIMSAAVLVGLQDVMMAVPALAETTCHLESQNDAASTAEKCPAPVRDKAALRAAHAQLGDAPEKQQPAATRCVATRGPSHRGTWQPGIDRATGHRCWRLVGTVKPHARIVPGAKSAPAAKSSAVSPVSGAARVSPVAAATTVQAYGPSQPTEVPTGSIAKSSEAVNVAVDPSAVATEAAVTSTPDQVGGDESQPFDLRLAWTAGQSLIGDIAAVVTTYADPAKLSADDMLEYASALISAHGRPAVFLIVFSSVLAMILALYGLIVGSLKVLRSSSLRGNVSAIRVTPQHYLENLTDRRRQDSPSSVSSRASPRALPLPEALRNRR